VRNPRDFAQPLAIGAPEPVLQVPLKPARMIHFFDPSNEKIAAKLPEIARSTDVLLGNLEDAIPADRKEAAREGLVRSAREADLGQTALWTRINSLDSPWVLDDLLRLIPEIGDRLEVIMVPKVEGPWDIHYIDRLLAQLEAKHRVERPILVHAILETALGVANLEEIATASPRMQGMSFGPADLAASRPPTPRTPRRPGRARSRTYGTTRSAAWSTPAPRPESSPSTGHSATSPTRPAARRSSGRRS
jgi:malyl-CoA/(S)-citramalyl-CoA lyase